MADQHESIDLMSTAADPSGSAGHSWFPGPPPPIYSCTLTPELVAKAREELQEKPEWRLRDVQALRDMILKVFGISIIVVVVVIVILLYLPPYFRNSPISGPDWMIPFSYASCGPGSLIMTVLCSCCSITTQVIKRGRRCSRTWSLPQLNMFWTRVSSQFCLTQILMADSSCVWGQVGIVSSDSGFVLIYFQPRGS